LIVPRVIARPSSHARDARRRPDEDTPMVRTSRRCAAALATALCIASTTPPTHAKPIAFANGATFMIEYGAGTMMETQAFYAPRYWLSLGGGALRLDSDVDGRTRDIAYLRVNTLVHRWNLPSAQANVFAWGGLGAARGSDFSGEQLARNAGVQVDVETRRLYAAVKTELHEADAFSHRIDTLQLGAAPYAHDFDTLATWFVLQARHYTGDLYDGIEVAALVRLFKGSTWVEAGVTADGKLQAMAMFNF
jgi:hypothetical protein